MAASEDDLTAPVLRDNDFQLVHLVVNFLKAFFALLVGAAITSLSSLTPLPGSLAPAVTLTSSFSEVLSKISHTVCILDLQ